MAKQGGLALNKLFAKLAERMKKDKRFELCVYSALVLLGVLIYAATTVPKGGNVEPAAANVADTVYSSERETEERLKSVLSCIRGAGEVEVMITYDTGAQIVPAMSTDTQTGVTQSSGAGSESKAAGTRRSCLRKSSPSYAVLSSLRKARRTSLYG